MRRLMFVSNAYYGAEGYSRAAKVVTNPLASQYKIVSSSSNTRSSPVDLSGTITGRPFVFLGDTTNVRKVTWELRNAANAVVPIPNGISLTPEGTRSESNPPLDYVGADSANLCLAFDTFLLANEAHTANGFIELLDGTLFTISHPFTVANAANSTPGSPTISGSRTDTVVAWTLTAPTVLGSPEWTGFEYEIYTNGVATPGTLAKTTLTFSKSGVSGDSIYARARTTNGISSSAWAISSTFVIPTATGVSDNEPINGLQATGSNRRPGIEVGIPNGFTPTGSGGLTTSSTAEIADRLFTAQFIYTGSGTKIMRRCKFRYQSSKNQPQVCNDGAGFLILIDCEIDGVDNSYSQSSRGKRIIFKRTWMHHIPEGPRLNEVEVLWCRVEGLTKSLEWTTLTRTYNHDDCVQSNGGDNWKVIGSHLDGRRIANALSGAGHGYAAVQISGTTGSEVAYCYITGGNFCFDGSGGAGVKIHDNLFADHSKYGYRNARSGDVFDSAKYNSSTGYGWHPTSNKGAPGTRYAGVPVPRGDVVMNNG